MRLLYQIDIDGKALQHGDIAGVPLDGDILQLEGGIYVEVRGRRWKHTKDHDAAYDSQLNCVVLDCVRVS